MKLFIYLKILSPIYKFLSAYKYFKKITINSLKLNYCYPIKIKTYEHSGQGVHPSLLYCPQRNPSFILSFTPYPFSRDIFENPSVLISSDGINFFEEKPNINPLVPASEKDHNNDPEIFIYNDKYFILYLETLRPEKQNLKLLESSDRINWKHSLIHTDYLNSDNPDPFILSPSFIHCMDKDFLFYVILSKNENNIIEYIVIKENFIPDFENRKKIKIDLQAFNPWHISIISDSRFFYMLISCVESINNKKNYNLYIARSTDITDWNFSKKLLLKNAYRSSGFIQDNYLNIFYSRETMLGAWEIGICKKNLKEYFSD